MSIRRILGRLALMTVVAAAAVSAWQAWLWFDNSRDNERIDDALAHRGAGITPDDRLALLFARGYGQTQLERYREAEAAYRSIWIRTDGGRRNDPHGYAARALYNLGNSYARRAVAKANQYDIDGARAMGELAKQAYRDALRARPGYWAVKHNFEAVQRIVRDLPERGAPEKPGDAPPKDVWSQMPGFPRGEP